MSSLGLSCAVELGALLGLDLLCGLDLLPIRLWLRCSDPTVVIVGFHEVEERVQDSRGDGWSPFPREEAAMTTASRPFRIGHVVLLAVQPRAYDAIQPLGPVRRVGRTRAERGVNLVLVPSSRFGSD